jgi:hypothetical protein
MTCRCHNFSCGRCAPTCCAICTSDRGPFAKEPLGRGDAFVNVCAGCNEPPIASFGPELPYEPDDRMPTLADSRMAWAPAAAPGGGWVGGKSVRGATSVERTAKRKARRDAVAKSGGGR